MEEQLLKEYVGTYLNPKYNGDWDVINSKFPELSGVDKELLKEYVGTYLNPKYNGDWSVVNSKFPELFPVGKAGVESPMAVAEEPKKKGVMASPFVDGGLEPTKFDPRTGKVVQEAPVFAKEKDFSGLAVQVQDENILTKQPRQERPLVSGESTKVVRPKDAEFGYQAQKAIETPLPQFVEEQLSTVTPSLIGKTEENVVPQLKYQFAPLGFNFKESSAGDYMIATSPSGESIEISLDITDAEGKKAEADKLNAFLRKGAGAVKNLSTLQSQYTEANKKILSQKELDDSLISINAEETNIMARNAEFVKTQSNLEAEKARLESVPPQQRNNPEYIARVNDFISRADQFSSDFQTFIKDAEDLSKRGDQLNKSIGKYTEMKAQQGTWYGAGLNAVFNKSIYDIAKGMAGLAVDFMGEVIPATGLPIMSQEDYEKNFIEQARKEGIDVPEGEDFVSLTSRLDAETIANIENRVIDAGKKIVKGEVIGALDKASNMAMESSGVSPEYYRSIEETFVGGALLGAGKSILPALTGNPILRTVLMSSQVLAGLDAEMANDPAFADVSENEKLLVKAPIAVAVGILENLGLSNLLKQKGFLNGLVLKALGKVGTGASYKTFGEVIKNEIDSAVGRGALTLGAGFLAEAETGALQEITDIGAKELYNMVKEKEMFDTPDSVVQFIEQVGKATLQEGIGAGVLAVPGSVSAAYTGKGFLGMDDAQFSMFEKMANDSNIQKAFVTRLKSRINTGEITASKGKEILDNYNNSVSLFNSLPDNLDMQGKKEAMNLLKEKRDLENQIAGKDQALTTPQRNRITQINEQLTKLSEDAIQKQAAGEVPVQPGTGVSQEVAQGEPQAEPKGVTQEGQVQEEVAPTQEELDLETQLAEDLNVIKSDTKPRLRVEGIDIPAEEDINLETIEMNLDRLPAYEVNFTTPEVSQDIQVNPIEESKSSTKGGTAESRPIEYFQGMPMIVGMSDTLAAGTVVDSMGNPMEVEGGLLYNVLGKNKNAAWAGVTDNGANTQYQEAFDTYNKNKELYEKLWAEGKLPYGHVPMAIMRMSDTAINSNEAVFRYLLPLVKSQPEANQKAALNALKSDIERKKITDKENLIEFISKNNIDSLGKLFDAVIADAKARAKGDLDNTLSLTDRSNLFDLIISPQGIKSASKNPVKELFGSKKDPKSKAFLADNIYEAIGEPAMLRIPRGNIAAVVGIDVLNGGVIPVEHGNYGFGPKGQMIALISNPKHGLDVFPEWKAKAVRVFKKTKTKEGEGKLPTATEIADQVGGAFFMDKAFRNARVDVNPSDVDILAAKLRFAFPDVTVSRTKEEFDRVLQEEGVRTKESEGKIILGMTKDGKIYLNPESDSLATPIHEFGHIWIDFLRSKASGKKGDALLSKGLSLVEGTKALQQAIAKYGDNALAREEALVELMATKGETIINKSKKKEFMNWLNSLFKYVKEFFITSEQFFKGTDFEQRLKEITLDDFINIGLADLLKGEPISSKFKAKDAADSPKARSSKAQRLAPNGKPSNLSEAQWNQVRTPEFKKWFGDWENDPENASKVVDENGEPLVMYHGSPSVDIESFDIDKGVRQKSGLREFANYFTSNKKLADLYRKSPLSKEYKNEIENLLREAKEKRSESRSNATWNFYTQEIDRLNSLFEGKIYEVFLNVKSPFEFNGGKLDMKGWDNASLDIGYKTVSGKAGVIEALSGNNSAYKNTEYDGVIATDLADMFYGTTDKNETKGAVKDLTGTVVAIWDAKQIKSATENVGTFDTGTSNIRFRVGDNVQSFINKARAQGYSEAAIKNVLTRSGVDADAIDTALAKAEPAAKKVEVTEEFAPGYNRVLNNIFGIIAKSRERNRPEEGTLENAINYLQGTKVYENATDVQSEAMVRNLRKEFKKREKAAPSAEKVIGKPKKKEVTVDEMAALKDQIKLEARAAREAKGDLNTKRKALAAAINKLADDGKITAKKAETIAKRALTINLDSEVAVNKFIDYVSKVFADADYASKLSNGNAIRTKIKKASRNKEKSANLRDLGVKFSEINPSMVEDIDQYNEIAEKIIKSIEGSSLKSGVKFAEIVKIADVSDYINTTIEKQRKEILKGKIDEMSELLGIEITEEEYFKIIESINNNQPLPKKYKDGAIRKAIDRAFNVYSAIIDDIFKTGKDPVTGEEVSISDKKKKVVKNFMSMDLNLLSDKEALAAIDSLLNFIQNGSIAKMSAVYNRNFGDKNAIKLDKKNFKSSKIKKYFSENLGQLLVEQFTQLDLVVERMFKGFNKAGDFMFEAGVSALKKGKSLAQSLNNKIVDNYFNTFYKSKPNGQEFNTIFNTVERGMTAYMMRTMAGTEAEINAEFKKKKGLIEQSIDTLKKGNDKQKELASVYTELYDKLVKGSENYDDVVSKADPKNVEAVRFWQNEWANKYEDLSDLSESIYNKTLGRDLNYTPVRVSNTGEGPEIDNNSDEMNRYEMAFHINNQTTYQRETGVLMTPTLDDKLSKGTFIDLSFDRNNANSMYDALIDLNTADAVRQIAGFFNSDSFEKIVQNGDDRKILKGRVNLFIRNIRNKNPYDNDEFAKAIRGLQNLAALGAGRALAGPTQAVKQTVPVIMNTIVNAGGIDFTVGFNKDKNDFINNSGYAIANRSAASNNQIESVNKLAEKTAKSLPSKIINPIADPLLQLNELQLKLFLQKPDAYVARASWMSYYEKSLRQQGIDTKSINYSTHELNDKAADYAQRMVDRQQNLSDMDLAGKFVGSKHPVAQFVNKTIMPFSSFRINQSARLGSDWAVLTSKVSTAEDRVVAARSLGGFFVELATFRAVSATISVVLASVASLISGREDDEEDREKLFDMTIKNATTSTIIDIVSFLPYMDDVFQAGIAKSLDVVQDMLEVEDADKFPFYDPKDKSWIEGLGMLGITGQRTADLIDLIDVAYTRDYKDDFGRTKYITEADADILKNFVLLNILSSVGIASPEIKTMTRRTLANVKRRSSTNVSGVKQERGSGSRGGGGGGGRAKTMNKSDLKRYFPEQYNQLYGEGSATYEIEQEIKAFEKEQREFKKSIKDQVYGGKD